MKSIPSLVASSTVGAAATGLVFGRPHASAPPRPSSNKRKATDYDMEQRVMSSQCSRPATSSTAATPNREEVSTSPLNSSQRSRPRTPSDRNSPLEGGTTNNAYLNSTLRRRDVSSPQDHGSGGRRDSLSSRNSWIRRLSTIQISSHQSSPRSSVGPDSPSLTFSHGSSAPILDTSGSLAPLPPNKLVKRTKSGKLPNGDIPARSGSRSQVPTLRRPATSHQRSVTLQQQYKQEGIDLKSPPQRTSPPQIPHRVIIGSFPPNGNRTSWKPYFDSHATKLTKERPSARSSEGSAEAFYAPSRRIILPEGSAPPTLLKPTMIMEPDSRKVPSWMETFATEADDPPSPVGFETPPTALGDDDESRKRPRRSLSMHFSSPTNWISRSTSLHATKRTGTLKSQGKRYVSAPVGPVPVQSPLSTQSESKRNGLANQAVYPNNSQDSDEDFESQSPLPTTAHLSRARTSSSPLPPLSRFSSFNLDLTRMGLSSSTSSAPRRSPSSPILHSSSPLPPLVTTNERSTSRSSPKVVIHQDISPRIPEVVGSDRASTLIGSDSENRGFASGEEDEMDFQSDTVFDSYRTEATSSHRTRNGPLESMFDDSPPTAHKMKLAITLDIAATTAFQDSYGRIAEEDEGMVTPIRPRIALKGEKIKPPTAATIDVTSDANLRSSPLNFTPVAKDLASLSLEEDEEDWTKDDDSVTISNPLSPPSSSVNSRRVSSALQNALAEVTKNGSSANAAHGDDRPKSLFDWSEPLNIEKTDVMGNSPRPKTVHGKQIIDVRGGRTVGRRGPNALHIRSQSVPVVPDVAGHREHGKLAPKFGTWGLGGKGANEDWDNDFEFDGAGAGMDENENASNSMTSSGMLVPESIQASQANVVGHVGQIREVCLLVEDLKRLRGLAREKGILDGTSANLWREAEGIIALAIPDEEDETLSLPQSPAYSFDFDSVDSKYRDGGFDIDEVNKVKDSGDPDNRTKKPATRLDHDDHYVRRQSVFSPEDDIFGAGGIAAAQRLGDEKRDSLKVTQDTRSKDSADVARSVMEHIHQHRVTSNPLHTGAVEEMKKMPFDTTSLRDLVNRANALSRLLAEIIRKADGSTQSPYRDPKVDRDSSPAFTRVFTEPLTSPPKHLPRSQSNNSILGGSIDSSPNRSLGKRMHMMTVV